MDDFRVDRYESDFVSRFYDLVGPRHITVIVKFLLGSDGYKKVVMHGIWIGQSTMQPPKLVNFRKLGYLAKLRGEAEFKSVTLLYMFMILYMLF